MKTKKKALTLALCAVLLVGATFLGTLAYLTDHDAVTNTFTVGNVEILLDEAIVDEDGKALADGSRTNDTVTGNEYHLLPGLTYDKDPTVTVVGGSEDCYVRMMVKVSDMTKLQAAFPSNDVDFAGYYKDGLFLLQNLCKGWDASKWECVGYDSESATYEFRYTSVVPKKAENTKLPALFTQVVIPGAITNDQLANLENFTIEVTAHAIQSAGFADANAAWGAWTN